MTVWLPASALPNKQACALLLAALVLGLASLAAQTSAPQTARTRTANDDFRTRATTRAGPLFLRPSVTLDKFGLETNVFNTPEERSDFVIAGTPRLETWLPIRPALLATSFGTRMEYYHKFEGERSINPSVASRIEVPFRRVTVAAGGDFLRTRQRPMYEIDLRARRVVTGLDSGIFVDVAPTLAVGLEAARERTRFDADAIFDDTLLSEVLNRDEDSARVAARWRGSALSTVVFAAEFMEASFIESPERDSANTIVTIGGEFHPRALISGSGEVGVRRFMARGADVTDITSMVARANLTYRLRSRSLVMFEAERDIMYSFRSDDPFYVLTAFAIAVRRQLTDPIDLTGRYRRAGYDYQGGTGRQDSLWSGEATIGYRLTPSTRIGFRFRYIERDSATDRWRYDGLQRGMVFDYGR